MMAESGTDRTSSATLGSAEDLFPQIHTDLREVERRLRQAIHSRVPVVPEVFLHTVHAGGKRVRPALALLSGRAVGTVNSQTFDVAVAVELIHLASLIHDDVIDDGGHRRGRLTANRVWGNKTAVLVADYIHSVVYSLLCRSCGPQVVDRLAATVVRMVEGELCQMFNEGSRDMGEPLYYQMICDKTASLMGLACELGARVSGADEAVVARLYEFGEKIGLAFQIVDDLLDLTGDAERIGKPVGNDIRCGRMTLPIIHTLHNGDAGARDELLPILEAGEIGHGELKRITALLDRAGGLDYAATSARTLSLEARDMLADLPASESRDALEALALYIVARTR